MRDRISCYNTNAEEIHDILLYESGITDSEKTNSLIALAAIIQRLEARIEKLETEEENPYHLKGEELEKANKDRISK